MTHAEPVKRPPRFDATGQGSANMDIRLGADAGEWVTKRQRGPTSASEPLSCDNTKPDNPKGPAANADQTEAVRSRLLQWITGNPAITKAQACQELGLARGTFDYHAQRLIRDGLVRLVRLQRSVYLFAPHIAPQIVPLLVARRSPFQVSILRHLNAVHKSSGSEIASELGVTRATAFRGIDALVRLGLIDRYESVRPLFQLSSASREAASEVGLELINGPKVAGDREGEIQVLVSRGR